MAGCMAIRSRLTLVTAPTLRAFMTKHAAAGCTRSILTRKAKKHLKEDAWNKYRIEAIGNSIRTFLNGVPVAHVIDDMTPVRIYMPASACDRQQGNRRHAGELEECTHSNHKPETKSCCECSHCEPDPEQLSTAAEKVAGVFVVVRWQVGKISGALTAVPNFLRRRWAYHDGVINISKSDGSETGNDIVTRKLYGPAFEFEFDFKLTEGANSGVKYFVDQKFASNGKVRNWLRIPGAG
jgi:hypothetical protein